MRKLITGNLTREEVGRGSRTALFVNERCTQGYVPGLYTGMYTRRDTYPEIHQEGYPRDIPPRVYLRL